MVQPGNERHQERGMNWQETEKEGMWEERRDWRLSIHSRDDAKRQNTFKFRLFVNNF
jgi:hypothetical protein